jgi:Holliday junction resolvase-like predicted endonuclease
MTYALRAGADAEEIAADFLAAKGMHIVARNFRTRFGEIDLIARDGGIPRVRGSAPAHLLRRRRDSVDVPSAPHRRAARAYLAR